VTLNLYATQQSVLQHARDNLAVSVHLTDLPAVETEPFGENGVMAPYAVLRVNDALRTTSSRKGGSVAGPRADEMYTLFDFLCVAADGDAATYLAYGPGGVADTMQGFVPVDAGPLERAGGGQVFVVHDGTGARPSNVIARVSFRCLVNMTTE
jgi:hypothetical protein